MYSRANPSANVAQHSPGTLVVYPITKVTTYRNEDGTGEIATCYDYFWYPGTVQIQERVTTLPVVPAEQNGSGAAPTRAERFDTFGNLIWLKDERGFISYYEYDIALGQVAQKIEDVDGAQLTLPDGWTTPAGGGLHLVTDYEYDNRGRVTQVLGPEHEVDMGGTPTTVRTAAWTVYKDTDREVWTAQGYATGTAPDYTYTLVNPVSISKENASGTRRESIQAVRASTADKLSASDSFTQSAYCRWSVTISDTQGRVVSARQYHAIPTSGDGTSGTNYDETTYGYDALGRQNRQETPGGTITRTVYNASDQPIAIYVGTDDTCATDDDPTGRDCYTGSSSSSSSSGSASGNNMVLLTEYEYAGSTGCTGCCGGGGAGQVVRAIQHVDSPLSRNGRGAGGEGGSNSVRITEFMYDWRNRQEFVLSDQDDQARWIYARNQYDNLDQVIRVERYYDVAGDGPDPDGGTHPDDILISRSETDYDDRGHVYRTRTYAVNPATGQVGDSLETNTWYDDAGNRTAAEDPLGRHTVWQYDSLGRTVKETLPDPDDEGEQLPPWTVFSYDAAGNLLSTTDRLDHATTFGYDAIGRRVSATDPNGATTHFAFDSAGNMASLTDPVENVTQWFYDHAARVVEEENQLGDSRFSEYNADGDLSKRTDRNGRVIEYGYDFLRRRTSETWKDGQTTVRTFSFAYNLQGERLTASDPAASYSYVYDKLGRVTSLTQEIDGLAPTVVLSQQYSLLGQRSQLATKLGGTADLVNDFCYDGLGRMSRIDQSGVTGGNAVAAKRVDFAYDDVAQFATLTRYNNLAGTHTVAHSSYNFDNTGRLVGLTHAKGQTILADYDWTFDAASRMTGYDNSIDGTADYTNDPAGQLTGADYTYQPPLADETYVYDANGNRTNNGYTVGPNNRLTSDGTHAYLYDDEGNRIARFVDADDDGEISSGDSDITVYSWDYRNRLVTVSHFADFAAYDADSPDKVVEHAYDHQNRWVRRFLDSDGDGDTDCSTVFLYDGSQILEHFEKAGSSSISADDLRHRYLWGPSVDQPLADEQVTSLETAGDVLWPLHDHLHTVRDLASYDSQTDTTTIANHCVYHAFGSLVSETAPSVAHLFCFTARPFDEHTGLQNNLNRWYDPSVGRWLSEDPLEYESKDFNSYRYVGNKPITYVDPSGMLPLVQDVIKLAEQRRGRGPWGDSAQHCWAACYIGVVFGGLAGFLAAGAETLAELFPPTGDWVRDIAANNVGAIAGSARETSLLCWVQLAPEWYCDTACMLG